MDDRARYHRGLERQLRKMGLSTDLPPADPEAWSDLLEAVSLTYREADDERYTLERSLEVSSQEMRALNDVLSHRARHDTLTGLPNRAALKEILQSMLSAQRQSGRDAAILFIDLDGFKLINDSLGHAVGDELLIRVAERIRSSVRPDDIVARLGGDEFVVLCPHVHDVDIAIDIARRIGDHLENPFRLSAQERATISASIGIAQAGEANTADELIGNADLAMYEAKAQGRARFLVFDDALRHRADDRLDTESALRHAVDQDELVLHFQPIVGLSDRRMRGAEALLRWNRPGRGLQQPAAFIPIAEQSRLISMLDGWVLAQACRQAAAWPDDQTYVSVNLSVRDLQSESLVEAVSAALQDSGLHPHRLLLELTETAVMSTGSAALQVLAEVGNLGVRVAIDDFGTGFWSPSQLRRMPVHLLKIDRSLTQGVESDETASAIAGAIAAMGHALGLSIVAEGIESAAQADALTRLGCDSGQGFLFGRPAEGPPTLG